jgi:hypothetical protein
VSEVDAIVEHHVPLLELPSRAPTPEGEVIGRTKAEGPAHGNVGGGEVPAMWSPLAS